MWSAKRRNATDGVYHMKSAFQAENKKANTKAIQIVLRGQIYLLKPGIELNSKATTKKKKNTPKNLTNTKKSKTQQLNCSYACDLDDRSGRASSLQLCLGMGHNCVSWGVLWRGRFSQQEEECIESFTQQPRLLLRLQQAMRTKMSGSQHINQQAFL